MITDSNKPGADSQLDLMGRDLRAWEGQVAGQHWIARVVYLDERAKICALHVCADGDRDNLQASPNCHWDYEYEHLVKRYAQQRVPHEVAVEMRDAVRDWVNGFLRAQRQQNLALTVRPPVSRSVRLNCSWLPAKEIACNRIPSHLG
jgi:hypothetical protein